MAPYRAATVPVAATSQLESRIVRVAAILARMGVLAFAAFLPVSIVGMQIGLGVAVAGVVIAWSAGVDVWRRSAPIALPVLILLCAAIASVALAWAAGIPPASLFRATLWKTFLTPLVVAAALRLEIPGACADASRARALTALAAWSAVAIAVGAVALVQPWTGFDPLSWLRPTPIRVSAGRASWPGHFHAVGFFTHYAMLPLNLLPPLAVSLAIGAFAPVEPWRRRLLRIGAAAAAVAAVLSLARSAWVALAVLGGVVVLAASARAAPRRLAARALAAGAALVALGVAVPGIRMRIEGGVTLAANADRLLIWRVCSAVRTDHPWVGTGLGNFTRVADPYFDRLAPGWIARSACHDTFLSFLVEGGPLLLAAIVAWFALLTAAFVRARRAALASGDAVGAAAAVGALAALAAALTNALVHDVLHVSASAYAIGFALGCAEVLAERPETSPQRRGGAMRPAGKDRRATRGPASLAAAPGASRT